MKGSTQEMYNITYLMYLLNHRGMALAEIGRIEEAIAILKYGIDLAEKYGVVIRMGALFNTLGYCYSEIHHPDRAWGFNVKSAEISRGLAGQDSLGRRQFLEMAAQGSVNMMENLYDQGELEKAWSGMELLKEEAKSNDFDFFRYRWESRMNYLAVQILLWRNDFDQANFVIQENLERARKTHMRKREGGFSRLLGEVQIRRGESDNAITNISEAIAILKEVGNARQLWQAHASLASAFDKLGKSSEAREQWGAAAEVIQNLANGLSDRELREGFLQADPIRGTLSKGNG
jgi:tetratricopeptide (TPR) repeat protein